MKQKLNSLLWFLEAQLGLNPIRFVLFFFRFPQYIFDFLKFNFQKKHFKKIHLKPCLHDRSDVAGDVNHEYFWQDLLVAQKVFKLGNNKNICDVGSRLDGFVAHLATAFPITVMDIRPTNLQIPNVKFIVNDLMQSKIFNQFDIVTCLHTIEHIGLGRYGDPIDHLGWEKALESLTRMLKTNGKLILTTPVGSKKILFNANYIFSTSELLHVSENLNLTLENFSILKNEKFHSIELNKSNIKLINEKKYALALFEFTKRG